MMNEPPAHLFVVFGATGDLARRKLLPALHRVSTEPDAPKQRVLGVGLDPGLDDDGFRRRAADALGEAGIANAEDWCREQLDFQPFTGHDDDFPKLAKRIAEVERDAGLPGNRVFYFAVPPRAFPTLIDGLGASELREGPGFTRLVIEKPFGRDLETAQELNRTVHQRFDESQIYRIDHFLGKETVQNLLVLRFANEIFEALWNRAHIDCVQITVAETLGVGGRSGYYDHVGALRDMVQNHLTQILTLIAMEVPLAYDADSIQVEKQKVLRAIRPLRSGDAVYGRYVAGSIGGDAVPGYREESGVDPASSIETYAAVQLELDTWRWQGVPFLLRTGKRMARDLTEIAVYFRRPPVSVFRSLNLVETTEDVLLLTLHPNEGFSLRMDVKRPGQPLELRKIPLDFRYASTFGALPAAYGTLLRDVLIGDRTLFVHAQEVELAWKVFTPLLESPPPVREYAAGSWGPDEADRLPAADGRRWRNDE